MKKYAETKRGDFFPTLKQPKRKRTSLKTDDGKHLVIEFLTKSKTCMILEEAVVNLQKVRGDLTILLGQNSGGLFLKKMNTNWLGVLFNLCYPAPRKPKLTVQHSILRSSIQPSSVGNERDL